MGRFGNFLGSPEIPKPAGPNESIPGVYSLETASYLRSLGRWPPSRVLDPYYTKTDLYLDVVDGAFKDLSQNAVTLLPNTGNSQTRLLETEGPAGTNILAPNYWRYSPAIQTYAPITNTIGTQDFTVECWFKLQSGAQNSGSRYTFFWFNGTNTYFYLNSSFYISGHTNSFSTNTFGTTAIADPYDTWHHVSFNRTAGSAYCILDGVKYGSTISDAINYTATNLYVSYNSSNYYFPGFITGVRLTVGAVRYADNTTYPSTTIALPYGTAQQSLAPDAPTITDAFYGDQEVTLNWTAGFDGGSSLTSYDIEYSTDNGSNWLTHASLTPTGPDPYGFSAETTFTKTDNGSEVDVIISGALELTRSSNQAIYNSAIETGWDQTVSPEDTEWALGWPPEGCGVENKSFGLFYNLWGGGNVGNNIVGAELVMRHIPTGRIWFIKFTSWTQAGQGGGFAYGRREFYGCLSWAIPYTVTGLTNGTPYVFRVRAVNAIGASAWSNVTTAVTPDATPPEALIGGTASYGSIGYAEDQYASATTKANKVFDNSLTNSTQDNQWRSVQIPRSIAVDFAQSVDVVWYRMWANTANTNTPTSWKLYGSNTQTAWDNVVNTTSADSSLTDWTEIDSRSGVTLSSVASSVPANEPYTDFAIQNPGSYQYYRLRVSAINSASTDAYLAEMQFLGVVPAPAVPTNLSAGATADGADLSWSYIGVAASFEVQWSDDASFATTLGTAVVTSANYTITGLVQGTTYYARVSTTNSQGTSAFTPNASFVPVQGYTPVTDSILRFKIDANSTSISVDAVSTSGYFYLEADTGESSSIAQTPSWFSGLYALYYTTASITGLTAGTDRMISVIPCDSSGTQSGDLEHVSLIQNNSGVTVTLIDASGCTSLDTLLAQSSNSNVIGNLFGGSRTSTLTAGLTEIRAINVPGHSGYYNSGSPYNYSYGAINVAGQQLSAAKLNRLYDDLAGGTGAGVIAVGGNPGTTSDDTSKATTKSYTVYGS